MKLLKIIWEFRAQATNIACSFFNSKAPFFWYSLSSRKKLTKAIHGKMLPTVFHDNYAQLQSNK